MILYPPEHEELFEFASSGGPLPQNVPHDSTGEVPPCKVLQFPYWRTRGPDEVVSIPAPEGEVVSFPFVQPANYWGWKKQEREFARIRRLMARELMLA